MTVVGRPTLQLATEAQAGGIARLSRDRIESGLGWSWTAPRVHRSIADRETNVVVAIVSGELAGFGIMKYHEGEAHLLLLAVSAACVRRGVGTSLVDWLEASARTAGIGQVLLEVRAANAGARAFYRRLGYAPLQQLPGYYQGREAAVRMEKDLWQDDPPVGPLTPGSFRRE